MIGLLLYFLIMSGTMLALSRWMPGFQVASLTSALVASAVLAAVNAVVKPVLFVLTLPFTIATLGLFLIVINAMCLWLVQSVVPGFSIRGTGTLLVSSLALAAVGMVWKAIATSSDD
jgi:putative membrane protein